MDGAHSHGSSGDGFGGTVATVAAVVLGVMGAAILLPIVLHILWIVAVTIGFTVMGAGAGWFAVWRWRRNRALYREAVAAQMPPSWRARVLPARARPEGPVALPQAGGMQVHHHWHVSPEQAADIMRRQQGGA